MASTSTITITPRVSVAGSTLSTTWQSALLEVRVERALNVPARVTLRFADPGYKLLQATTVKLTTTLKVSGPGGDKTLFQGIVTSVGAEQREGEQPELVVVGHDKSYKLGLNSRVKTWTTTSVATILSAVLSSSGLSATSGSSASSTTPKYALQVDTDLGMLGELARRMGADWWVVGTTLYFGKPNELTSNRNTVSLTLGAGLHAFSARAMPAPTSVSVSGWDPVGQQTVTGSATTATSGVLPTSTLAGLATGAATFVSAALGARSATEATTLSQSVFDLRASAAVEATGTAVGHDTIAPGGKVTVAGAGPLSGSYPVTAVEHIYRPRRGYITRFRSGDRRPEGLGDGRGSGAGMMGSIVGHFGVTAGVVTNIKTPTTHGRVKLRFPGMASTQESAWARVVAMGGGTARGNVFLPEVTDEVLVAFEDGDTRAPVVIGGLFGTKLSMPKVTITTGKVAKRELVSRLGHAFRFLDGTSTDKKAIELALADGANTIHLGSDKTTVTVKSGNAFTIKVGSTTITVAASTGAVTVKAATVTISATSQLKMTAPKIAISSTGTLTLTATGMVTLTGASVTVSSKANVSISGTPVSVNGG